jgi:phosphoserine phosphatase
MRNWLLLACGLALIACAPTDTDTPAATATSSGAAANANPLPSWNAGPSRSAILDFVQRTTTPGSPDFIPVAERIATFDNDGCLWSEQPAYFQLAFAIDRSKMLAAHNPELAQNPVLEALASGDEQALAGITEHDLVELVAATHSGMTLEEFQDVVANWFAVARHPRFNVPYSQLIYQPMLELLDYLRANEFKTFIVSGGGVDFLRVFAEQAYGIPPEQVVGSMGDTEFEIRDGKPVLIKQPGINFVDDKEGKPVGIARFIGRRPVFAFGNSDGDLQMLQYTAGGDGARFMGYVHHDDAEREWAYDRGSHIGGLDKGLDEALERGWTVVSMKDEWAKIYPGEGLP